MKVSNDRACNVFIWLHQNKKSKKTNCLILQSPLCDIELVIMVMMGSNFKLLYNEISFLLLFSFIVQNVLQSEQVKAAMTSNFLQLGCENNTYHTVTVALFESGQKSKRKQKKLWQKLKRGNLPELCHWFPSHQNPVAMTSHVQVLTVSSILQAVSSVVVPLSASSFISSSESASTFPVPLTRPG